MSQTSAYLSMTDKERKGIDPVHLTKPPLLHLWNGRHDLPLPCVRELFWAWEKRLMPCFGSSRAEERAGKTWTGIPALALLRTALGKWNQLFQTHAHHLAKGALVTTWRAIGQWTDLAAFQASQRYHSVLVCSLLLSVVTSFSLPFFYSPRTEPALSPGLPAQMIDLSVTHTRFQILSVI